MKWIEEELSYQILLLICSSSISNNLFVLLFTHSSANSQSWILQCSYLFSIDFIYLVDWSFLFYFFFLLDFIFFRIFNFLFIIVFIVDCLVTIAREEGFVGLYKGIIPSLLLTSHGAVQVEVSLLSQSFFFWCVTDMNIYHNICNDFSFIA